jgi:hypothetical protein
MAARYESGGDGEERRHVLARGNQTRIAFLAGGSDGSACVQALLHHERFKPLAFVASDRGVAGA